MDFGGRLFAWFAVFYFLVTAVYWYMSQEIIGTTVLALTGGLAFLIGFYTLFTSNRVGALPEDIEHAKISVDSCNKARSIIIPCLIIEHKFFKY
jgi:hypothetical protein